MNESRLVLVVLLVALAGCSALPIGGDSTEGAASVEVYELRTDPPSAKLTVEQTSDGPMLQIRPENATVNTEYQYTHDPVYKGQPVLNASGPELSEIQELQRALREVEGTKGLAIEELSDQNHDRLRDELGKTNLIQYNGSVFYAYTKVEQ